MNNRSSIRLDIIIFFKPRPNSTHFRELVQTERHSPKWLICKRPDNGVGPSTNRTSGSDRAGPVSMAFMTILESALPCVSRRKSNKNKQTNKKGELKLWTQRWVIQLPLCRPCFPLRDNVKLLPTIVLSGCIMTKLSWHSSKKKNEHKSRDFLLVKKWNKQTKIRVHLHARWIFLRRKETNQTFSFSFRTFTSLISDMCLCIREQTRNHNRHGHWNPQMIYQ